MVHGGHHANVEDAGFWRNLVGGKWVEAVVLMRKGSCAIPWRETVSTGPLTRLYAWRRLLDSLPLSDEDLWRERAGRGDAAALGQIYDAYAIRIFKYLYRRLGSIPLAEDLTADVFVRLVETAGTPSFCRGSLAPWLYRLAHNRLVDHYRRRHELPFPDDPDSIGMPAVESADTRVHGGELRVALRQLTSDQQQVIVLKFAEGLSNAEIAAALDKPEGAVKSLQHRALASLRRLLGDGDGEA